MEQPQNFNWPTARKNMLEELWYLIKNTWRFQDWNYPPLETLSSQTENSQSRSSLENQGKKRNQKYYWMLKSIFKLCELREESAYFNLFFLFPAE